MQQRFAYALLIRLTNSPTPVGPSVEKLHGTVQAVDAPEAMHFTSLRQLARWIELVMPPDVSIQQSSQPNTNLSDLPNSH